MRSSLYLPNICKVHSQNTVLENITHVIYFHEFEVTKLQNNKKFKYKSSITN